MAAAAVRELAGRTAPATDGITRQIHALQNAAGKAVSALGTITGAVVELSRLTLAIAGATGTPAETVRALSERLAPHSTGLAAARETSLKAV